MAARNKEYRRLPGRRWFTAFGTDSVWLGPDHVLSVSNQVITEDYRRFAYRDLQALRLVRTPARDFYNFAFGGLAGLASLGVYFGEASRPFWILVMGCFLALVLVNTLRGPTCDCYLITAVHRERLRSLCRERPAVRALELVRARAEAAQGRLGREEAEGFEGTLGPAPRAEPPEPAPGPARSAPGAYRGAGGAALALLALSGMLDSVDIFYRAPSLSVLGVLVGIAMVSAAVLALVRSRGHPAAGAVRPWLWATSVYSVLWMVVGSVVSTALSVLATQEGSANPYALAARLNSTPTRETPALLAVSVVFAAAAWIIAAGGLAALARGGRPGRG